MALDRWLTVVPGTAAAGGQQAAFLVDADNFSDALALESAWAQVQARAGRVSVCRAYGAPTRLQSLAAVWRSLGARTFPNLALDKNTTDAALIADAVALHFQQGVRLFAIASGDADFAPLAVRLREWGCEVWCFSMSGILFAGAEAYYDRVVRFAPSPAVNADLPAPKPPPSAVVAAVAPVVVRPAALPVPPAVEKSPPLVPCPAPAAPTPLAPALLPAPVMVKPKPIPVVQPPAKPAPSPLLKVAAKSLALPEEVVRILQALPALRETPQMLSQVVPVLRQKTILGKTTKTTTFFASYSEYFQLSPAHQPTLLTYVPPRRVTEQAAPQASTKPAQSGKKEICPLAAAPGKVPIAIQPAPICLKDAPPLLAELHGLRSVLIQLAVRRVTIADVLLAAPEVAVGLLMDLGSVCKKLCDKGVVASPAYARAILMAYPSSFCLVPTKTPNAVRYLG